MSYTLRKIVSQGFKVSLLLLFLGYYSSITCFVHSHVINGVTIVHSHPFNKSSDQEADAGSNAIAHIQLISQLSHFVTSGEVGLDTWCVIEQPCRLIDTDSLPVPIYSGWMLDLLRFRGPPAYLS